MGLLLESSSRLVWCLGVSLEPRFTGMGFVLGPMGAGLVAWMLVLGLKLGSLEQDKSLVSWELAWCWVGS